MNATDAAEDGRSSLLGVLRSKRLLIPLVALVFLFLLNYAWTFYDLVRGWIARDRLILGLVVLTGAAFLVWDRRKEVARAEVKPSKWGLAFVAFSLLLLFVGTRAGLVFAGGMSSVFLRGVSFAVFLCGAVVLLLGWQIMRPLWLPAILLLFMYPENYFTALWVPLRLQTLAAVISERVVSLLGNVVVREGHVLETAGFSANVEEACSGIRSLMTVIPTALFLGAYGLRTTGAKLALVLLAVPLTILANVFRVSVTVLLGTYVGREAAEGFFHYFAGMGIFLICLIGLLVLVKLLGMADRQGLNKQKATDLQVGQTLTTLNFPPLRVNGIFFTAVGVLVLGIAYQGFEFGWGHANSRKYPDAPLNEIPKTIGKWAGKELEIDREMFEARHWTDYLSREYTAIDGPPISVFALYWKRGAGTFIGRRAHLPESCYPYHGMEQQWTQVCEVQTDSQSIPKIVLRHSIFSSSSGEVLVTSWQESLGTGTEVGMAKSRLGLMMYGLKELFSLGKDYPPELACQFITPLVMPAEGITSAHREFARTFIPQTVKSVVRLHGEEGAGSGR